MKRSAPTLTLQTTKRPSSVKNARHGLFHVSYLREIDTLETRYFVEVLWLLRTGGTLPTELRHAILHLMMDREVDRHDIPQSVKLEHDFLPGSSDEIGKVLATILRLVNKIPLSVYTFTDGRFSRESLEITLVFDALRINAAELMYHNEYNMFQHVEIILDTGHPPTILLTLPFTIAQKVAPIYNAIRF